jgi:hypothetical protein
VSRGGAGRKKGQRKIDSILEEMHPAQRDGMTIDGEDVGTQPASSPTTSDLIGHMAKDSGGKVGRIPSIKFVAENDPQEYWSLGDDRLVAGADVTYTPETFKAMQAGLICMRCMEPQYVEFPETCCMEFCGYPIKELQIRDLALEFKGEKHLGPSKPITEFMDEAEEKYLKKKFEDKIAAGKSPMKGLKHRAS